MTTLTPMRAIYPRYPDGDVPCLSRVVGGKNKVDRIGYGDVMVYVDADHNVYMNPEGTPVCKVSDLRWEWGCISCDQYWLWTTTCVQPVGLTPS